MKTKQCEVRNHRWDKKDAKGKGIPGTSKCLDCEQLCGTRVRKSAAVPAAPAQPVQGTYIPPAAPAAAQPRPINEALAKKWGLNATAGNLVPDASPAPATEQPAADEKPKKRVNLARIFKDNAPGLLISGPAYVIELFGREPGEVDEDMEADLKECTDELIDQKAPKVELSPGWGALAVLLLITVQMVWKSRRMPEPEKKALPPTQPDRAAVSPSASATTETTPKSPSPSSSSPTPTLSLVPADGTVTGAEQPASVE
jgi:hypothetical protein